MKSIKLFLTAILFFVLGFAQAQNDYNPWKKYGYTPPKALTLSDGKYQEFFDADTIVQIGSVLFNTVTNEVVAFIKYDTTYSEATLEPHIISRWLSPDPLAQERPSWTPYNFCSDNPINRIDPDGRLDDIVITGENKSSVTLKTDMIDIKVNASSLGINFGGNHVLQGEDVLSAGLDIVGVFDVSGISDGFGAGLAWKKGDYWSATISGLSILPFGDFLKVGKIGKDIKIIENAIDATKRIGPAGDAGATVTKQIPSNWSMKTSKNGQGTVFKDPNNPTGNNVRVQGGNPNSPNTSQQAPYVKQTSNGKTVDVNGKQVDPKSPESHIPKSDFKYKK
jgi:hypothetical protein